MSRLKDWYPKEFSQIAIQMCLKICAISTDLDFGVLSIKSMVLYFSELNINLRHGVHTIDSFAHPSNMIYDSCLYISK